MTASKTLWLPGKVDIAVVDALRDAWYEVAQRGAHEVLIVDLGAVTFMDAAGLGLLVGLRTRQEAHGGAVRLINVPKSIVRLLRLTGLLDQFLGLSPDPKGLPTDGIIDLRAACPATVSATGDVSRDGSSGDPPSSPAATWAPRRRPGPPAQRSAT